MLPRIIEQIEIIPGFSFGRFLRLGSSLKSAITLFSLRTLLRSRQHRMILSIYLGLGLAIVLGFIKSRFVGSTDSHAGVSLTILLASSLMVILTILALRVVASIPITLRANWIFRATQVRSARHYLSAVRLSWLAL